MNLVPASACALAATQEKNACQPTSLEQDSQSPINDLSSPYLEKQFRKDVAEILGPLKSGLLTQKDLLSLQIKTKKLAAEIAEIPVPPEKSSHNDRPSRVEDLWKQAPWKQVSWAWRFLRYQAPSGSTWVISPGQWAIQMFDSPWIDYSMLDWPAIIEDIDRILEERIFAVALLSPICITERHDLSRALTNYAKSKSSEVIAEIDRILEERNVYAELCPILLDRSITVAIDLSPGQSAQYVVSRGLSDYLPNHTLEQGQGRWHTDRLGQSPIYLGGIHLHRTRLPRRKASLLRALSLASIAGILVAGAHLPGGLRTVTGVLSTSAAVANIPMHMYSEYPALRWSLFAFCLIAYAAFVGFLWDSLKGKGKRQPAYLFFAIFTGVGAIGTTLVADKVDDTVKSVLAFGPLELTLIAGLFYMPFRYGFNIGADPADMIEMQVQPGQLRRHQTS